MHHSEIRTEHLAQLHQWLEGDALSEKAKQRLRCILQYLEHRSSMAEAAAMHGMTPNGLRRWLSRFDPSDPRSLEEKSRLAHSVRTTQLPIHVVALIRSYRVEATKMGKAEISLKLKQDHGIEASPSAIGRVIERECLYFGDSPLHVRKRLQAHMVMPAAPIAPVLPVVTVTTETAQTVTSPTPVSTNTRKIVIRTLVASLLLLGTVLGYGAGRQRANVTPEEIQMSVDETLPPDLLP